MQKKKFDMCKTKTSIISIIISIIRLCYSWRVYHYIREKKVRLYTYWITPEFNSVGKNCIIEKMRSLIGAKRITIGNNCTIGINSQLTAHESFRDYDYSPQIVIGNNVSLGDNIHITAINSIQICDGVLTGRWVTISDHSHGRVVPSEMSIAPNYRELYSKGNVYIGKNVWIGDKVSIMPGVTIGEGCIIGANTVVTKSIPPFSVVGGAPGKIIKTISQS